ncbi:sugar ABC transporter permease [Mycoplasmopsis agassizii]|uniref:ABC transporter permease subunit n=1 Tax=Mycoplasmopsis agassizii TaxID=33922 RepID=UPI0035272601
MSKQNKSNPVGNFVSDIKSQINKVLDTIGDRIKEQKAKYRATTYYKKTSPYTRFIKKHLNRNSMYYILLFVVVLFSIWTSISSTSHLLAPDQFSTMLRGNIQIVLISLPMLWVIISGNIDLSVGRLFGLVGYISVRTYIETNGSLAAAFFTAIAVGLAIGLATGFLVGYLKIPAFIVTLGGMLLFQGLLLYLSEGKTILSSSAAQGIDGQSFKDFTLLTIDFNIGSDGANFYIVAFLLFMVIGVLVVVANVIAYIQKKKFGLNPGHIAFLVIKQVFVIGFFLAIALLLAMSSLGLQLYILYAVIIIAIFMFISKNTRFGRAIYAIGGNKKAAALSGVNVQFTTMMIFVVIGVVSGFTGLVFASIQQAIVAGAGASQELTVISSVFVGGASVSGGIGTVVGTIIGSFIINFIQLGMNILEQQAAFINIIQAAILVSVVAYDTLTRRKVS